MSIYSYLVVNKRGRVDDLESLEEQERKVAQYAAAHSMLIAEWFRERNISRYQPFDKRSVGAELFKKLRSGDTVLFSTFGSFVTSPAEALKLVPPLIDKKISLHFLDLGGDVFKEHCQLLIKIFEAFRKEALSVRALRGQSTRKDGDPSGYKGGVPPYGFFYDKKTGKLTEHPWRKNVILSIAKCIDEGLAIRPICQRVKEETGQSISAFTVQRLQASEEIQKALKIVKDLKVLDQ